MHIAWILEHTKFIPKPIRKMIAIRIISRINKQRRKLDKRFDAIEDAIRKLGD